MAAPVPEAPLFPEEEKDPIPGRANMRFRRYVFTENFGDAEGMRFFGVSAADIISVMKAAGGPVQLWDCNWACLGWHERPTRPDGSIGFYHIHGAVACTNQRSPKFINDIFPHAWVAPAARNATCQDQRDYILKHGEDHLICEVGKMPDGAEKESPHAIMELIQTGADFATIARQFPSAGLHASVGIERCILAFKAKPDYTYFDDHPYRPPQQFVHDFMHVKPDGRSFLYIEDPVGNSGKTWASISMHIHHGAQLLTSADTRDLLYIMDPRKLMTYCTWPGYHFDFTRQQHLASFTAVEASLSGKWLRGKYMSQLIMGPPGATVVSTNVPADKNVCSVDRWIIMHIDSKTTYHIEWPSVATELYYTNAMQHLAPHDYDHGISHGAAPAAPAPAPAPAPPPPPPPAPAPAPAPLLKAPDEEEEEDDCLILDPPAADAAAIFPNPFPPARRRRLQQRQVDWDHWDSGVSQWRSQDDE